jgi:hypothetical protein
LFGNDGAGAIPAVSKPDILSNPLVFGTMYSIRSLPAADKEYYITSTGY